MYNSVPYFCLQGVNQPHSAVLLCLPLTEKHPGVSDAWFKPVLFKNQLYIHKMNAFLHHLEPFSFYNDHMINDQTNK